MGSETPQQMGWYWVVLATEYELLKRNGQNEEAQRTLEELFLGLQAYRRLDMQAQCLVQKRYEEITDNFEVEACENGYCLCGEKYREGGHINFDSPCFANCDFTPQLDGYSGFFLREDATQDLEIMHDPSEDKYNIDLVSSDYAMSLSPPCEANFSQPCYLVHRQNFMSQDGMTGLMLGLAMIKRYIPENAEVTTCDGQKFKPLEMARRISSAIVDNVDDRYMNRIAWPKSNVCCAKEVFLSEREGGRLEFTIKGFKKAADYIDDHNRHSNLDEMFGWWGLTQSTLYTNSTNAKFWLRLKAIGWDMGEDDPIQISAFYGEAELQNLEILLLMNNLLHPEGNNLGVNQAYFEALLCNAPCQGPCRKQDGYNDNDPAWPSFDCSNTPRWQGQGWETGGDNGISRLFNGLDYMALYNIYLLHFNQPVTNYYNPERAPRNASFGSAYITGPSLLCADQTAYYEAQPIYCTSTGPDCIHPISWLGSANLNILSPNVNGADVYALSSQPGSFLEASFWENRKVLHHKNSDPAVIVDTIADACAFTYRKPLVVDLPEYFIETDFDHCNHQYSFSAVGEDIVDASFLWRLNIYYAGGTTTLFINGKNGSITNWALPGGNSGGMIVITLTISNDCGQYTVHTVRSYSCSSSQRLLISPNPGNQEVFIGITDDYEVNAVEGLEVRFINTGLGIVQGTRQIYTNGEMVDISNFPEGAYNVQTTLENNTLLNTALIISRQ